jgi:PPM family protein phosphatase
MVGTAKTMHKFSFDTFHASDIGFKRELNEDHCFAELVDNPVHEGIVGTLAVADGVGGQDAGDVASKIACDAIQHLFARSGYVAFARESGIAENDYSGLLAESLRYIHQKIVDRALTFNMPRTMGCTCVVGLIVCDERTGITSLFLSWAGDSRCYIKRGSEILLATEDDSYVWDLYKQGKISYSDMRTHPKRNVVTQALGTGTPIRPRSNVVELKPNDVILLCTDGLHSEIIDQEIKRILETTHDAEQACRKLITSANKAGGRDNISAVVVRCSGGAPMTSELAPRKIRTIARAAIACALLAAGVTFSYVYVTPPSTVRPVPASPGTLTIQPVHDSFTIGQPVPIRFTVGPHAVLADRQKRYLVVAVIDSESPNSEPLTSIPDANDGNFSMSVKFKTAAIHLLTLRLLEGRTRATLCSGTTSVTIREPLPSKPPERREASAKAPSEKSVIPLFVFVKGIDGKLLVKPTKAIGIDRNMDVDISCRGHEEVVTLSRINKSIPKETSLEYYSGAIVVARIIGTRQSFARTLR